MSFGLVTYAGDEGPRVGVLAGDRIADAEPVLTPLLGGEAQMQAVLDGWERALPALTRLADELRSGRLTNTLDRAAVRLLAPLPRPVNLYCAFANYVDHMLEMGGQPANKAVEDPFLFLVPATAITATETPIVVDPAIDRLDWEGELAAVIGRAGRNLTLENALDHVAGYSILHDVSIRGGARRGSNGGRPDFLASKGRATFKPFGPAIVPARFVADPQALALRTRVNGVLKQNSNTAQMIFTTAEQIVHVSRLTGIVPGDVFATGTPAGVGMPRGEFLRPGDEIEIEIDGLGTLRNRSLAE